MTAAMLFAATLSNAIIAPAIAQAADDSRIETLFWESVATSDDRAQYAAYLTRFPNGVFAELARLKMAAIDRRTGAAPAAASPASTPTPAPSAMVAAGMTAPMALAAPASQPVRMPSATPAPAAPTNVKAMSVAQLLDQGAPQKTTAYFGRDAVAQALPAPPVLTPAPALVFPARFCDAEERNRFHESSYTTARAISNENNQKTIAHSQALQQVYDRFAATHDELAMTMISETATAYQAVAAQAFTDSKAIAARYTELMAVPIGDCD